MNFRMVPKPRPRKECFTGLTLKSGAESAGVLGANFVRLLFSLSESRARRDLLGLLMAVFLMVTK